MKRVLTPSLAACVAALTAAVLCVQALPQLPPWWYAAAPLLLAALPWRGRWLCGVFALALLFMLLRAEQRLDQRWPDTRNGQTVVALGHIADLPEASADSPRVNTWRFTFAPASPDLPARIHTSVYRSPLHFAAGECWQLTLRVKTPHGTVNPGGSDYEGRLFRQGIGAVATGKAPQPCTLPARFAVQRLRESLRNQLQQWLAPDTGLALLIATVMGDTSALSTADWDALRRTGTSHLIAISGFNLAIVAAWVFFALRWSIALWPAAIIRLPAQTLAAIGAALAAGAYALLAGAEPPVLRALWMLWVGLAVLLLRRKVAGQHALLLAWAVQVLADPFCLMAPGTWLSYGAVASILYLVQGRWQPEAGWKTALRVQLGLSLLLLPLGLGLFQAASWTAPWVNLLAVPAFAVLTPLALIAVLAAYAYAPLGIPLLQLCAAALNGLQQAFAAVALSHPQGYWQLAPSPWALSLALLGSVLLLAPRSIPLKPLALACWLPLFFSPPSAAIKGVQITVLDVGQGLATVVRTAQHTLVFDAGRAYSDSFDSGANIIAPYLRQQGVQAIDVMMISHTDLDHAGGAPGLRAQLPIREERGALAGSPCAAGQQWDWDGVRFTVLNGPINSQGEPHPDNNGGCVLRVALGSHAVLLAADIERPAELRLLAAGQPLKADLLVAPHHGSKTSSTPEFLDAVNPEWVVFSAGYGNSFGHPAPPIVERYMALGSQMVMTGQQGAARFTLSTEGLSPPMLWRDTGRRYWWHRSIALE